MHSVKFSKPSLSISQQVRLLRNRGLIIDDLFFLQQKLQTVGYYRLSAYCKSFQKNDDSFVKGTTFTQIWNLYTFDMQLRNLVSAAIQHIEIATRTTISNCMSESAGPYWYVKRDLYKSNRCENFYLRLIQQFDAACCSRKEVFMEHFYDRYTNNYPPSWMIFECLSFGTIATIFKNLRSMQHKKYIAKFFGYHPTLFESWIECCCYLRNICAHHNRLWNRWFVLTPILPNNFNISTSIKKRISHKFYAHALIITKLLSKIAPELNWSKQLHILLGSYTDIDKKEMGFGYKWHEESIWENSHHRIALDFNIQEHSEKNYFNN